MARRVRSPLLGGWTPHAATLVEPATALARSGLALYSWHLGSDTIAWSPQAAEVLGMASLDLIARGDGMRELIEPGSGAGSVETVLASPDSDIGHGVPYRTRYALRTRPDRLMAVEDFGRWHADAQGRPALLRGVLCAELSGSGAFSNNLRARAALLADIFDDVLQAQRSRRAVTLVVGQLGGEDGALDIAAVEERVRPLLRRRDRFLRYAPDRFALVLASCPAAEAEHAVQRLSHLIGDARVRLGASSAPDHALDAPQLLRRAEEAMERGPGAASVYQPANPDARPASGTPPDRIVAALNERRLVAGYRPVLDARSRRPVFATLVPHLLGPDGAVPVGDLHEAAGGSLAPLVDLRLVELAATRLAHNPADRVALCVSSESLESREWLEGLAAHLGARPGIESRLVVTVDEASLLEPATRGRLDAVKALGVGLMLAGFGTGHASIRHLRSHPIDILRIGAALIHGLTRSPEARGVVRGLVDLAQHCGVATLAEGVEDETGARLLAEWGVDYIEGPLTGAAGVDLGQARPSRRSHAA